MPSTVTTTSDPGRFDSSFKTGPLEHLRTVFCTFVQAIFEAAPPGAYHWTPDERTEIVIRDENPINVDTLNTRPAINFTRGPLQWYRLGQGDIYHWRSDISQVTKTVLLPTTMSINCSARNDIESERLAFIVCEYIWLLREKLTQAGLFDIGMPGIGSPSQGGAVIQGDSADEWYVTAATIPVHMFRTSQFTELGHEVVRNIEVRMNSILSPVNIDRGTFPPGTSVLPVNDSSTPAQVLTPSSLDGARVPSPLNPLVQSRVKYVYPSRPGAKPPEPGVVVLPFSDKRVEESSRTTEVRTTKV